MNIDDEGRTPDGGASFPKECRLRHAAEFKAVYGQGRRRASGSFVVFALPNRNNAPRFGLTTSRKLGKAVERNRIRRRIREILRREKQNVPQGFDIVINPRRSVLTRDFSALRAELASLLRAVP